jgi:hypothetical protein
LLLSSSIEMVQLSGSEKVHRWSSDFRFRDKVRMKNVFMFS